MDYTQNYKLKKPSYDDPADVADLNENADKIDEYLKAAEQSAEHMGEELNDHIADQVKHITAEERAKWDAKAETDTATTTSDGLMSAADKEKLDGVAEGANKYTLPTASSSTLGGVKTSSTVTSSSGYTACPIISGVPYYKDTNTTYPTATSSANGLMSSSDKKKLDGIYSGATPVTIRTGNLPKFGDENDTVSLAYISGRKNALVMVYLHGTISSLNYSAFDSMLLTGISNSMTSSSSVINTGSNTGCTVKISTAGVITLKPYSGAIVPQRYIVIYYN